MLHQNEPPVVDIDLDRDPTVLLTDNVDHVEVHENMDVHVVAKKPFGSRNAFRVVSKSGNFLEVLHASTKRMVRLNTSDEYLFAATQQGIPIIHVGAGDQFTEGQRGK